MVLGALRFAIPLSLGLLAASPVFAQGTASTLDEELRLNTAITVTGETITLGDVFSGYLSRPEKVVAQAPRPGQRMVLSAEWLADLARTYGLGWHPINAFDRAIVYQPGTTISTQEILDAVKAALVATGMPANYGINSQVKLSPVTIATTAPRDMEVREAVFDVQTRSYTALVQIPPGEPNAVFIPLRGAAYPTVQVPVVKEGVGKNAVITAAMIDTIDLPEDAVKANTIVDPAQLIGKTPKVFLRAGQPVRDTDVTQITLVDIPVLVSDMDRDGTITRHNIKVVSVNAADVPPDAVSDADYLVGKTPRRPLGAGLPIRRADVHSVQHIEVPVAARDLPRGATLTEADVAWVTMDKADVVGEIAGANNELIGQVTRHAMRAGQVMRSHSVARPIAVERNKPVLISWSSGAMNLTAQGLTMEAGSVGDVIRVTNTKSKTSINAEVIDSRTVRVLGSPQQAEAR